MPIDAAAPDLLKRLAFAALLAAVATITFSISLFEISAGATMLLTIIAVAKKRDVGRVRGFFLCAALAYFAFNLISLTQSHYAAPSLRGIFKVFRHVLLGLSVLYLVDSEDKFKSVLRVMFWTALVIGADAVYQGLSGEDFLRGRGMTAYIGNIQRLTGPFRHANDFSAYLSLIFVVFVVAFFERAQIFRSASLAFFTLGAVLLGGCLFGTYSRGAWVAAAFSLTAYALFRKNRWLIALLIALAAWALFFSPPATRERLASLADLQNNTIAERRELWGESARMIKASPWIGLGVNTYARNQLFYESKNPRLDNQYPHNGYLQMAAEIGLLGLTSFLALVAYSLFFLLARFSRAPGHFVSGAGTALVFGMISFLLQSATDTTLHSVLLINTLWLTLGMTWAAERCLKS